MPNDPIRDVERFDAYRAALRDAVTPAPAGRSARGRKVQFLHRRSQTAPTRRRSAA